MVGLLSGRYITRLMGAAAAGALATASIAPARADGTRVIPVDITNIAAAANGGRVLGATSTLTDDPAFNAANLIDGQVYNTESKTGSAGWASNKFDPINMDYVTFAFKNTEVKRLGKLVFNDVAAVNPERWAKDIEVQVSTDSPEGPYTPVAQITLKRTAERQSFAILPVDAKYVRLMFRSNWGSDRSVALGEVEMYEAIDTSDAVGGVIGRLEQSIHDLEQYAQTQSEFKDSLGGGAASASVHSVAMAKTAGADTVRGNGGNLAAAKNGGHIVDVSSVFEHDPKYAAENVIDGQNYDLAGDKGSYGWSSEGFAPGKQFITIGFRDDRTRVIKKLVINPVSNQSALRWASRIDVQVTSGSAKEGPFRTVATFNIRQEPTNQDFDLQPVEAKYVRFVFTANGPGNPLPLGDPNVSSDRAVSVGEIEVYELAADSGVLDSLIGRFRQVLVDMKNLRRTGTGMGASPASADASAVAGPVPVALVAAPAAATAVATLPAAPTVRVQPAARIGAPAHGQAAASARKTAVSKPKVKTPAAYSKRWDEQVR